MLFSGSGWCDCIRGRNCLIESCLFVDCRCCCVLGGGWCACCNVIVCMLFGGGTGMTVPGAEVAIGVECCIELG